MQSGIFSNRLSESHLLTNVPFTKNVWSCLSLSAFHLSIISDAAANGRFRDCHVSIPNVCLRHHRRVSSSSRLACLLQVSAFCSLLIVDDSRSEMKRYRTGLLIKSPKAGTSMDESQRDWASLPLPVVDSLVRVLKNTRRWRLEGVRPLI